MPAYPVRGYADNIPQAGHPRSMGATPTKDIKHLDLNKKENHE